MLHAVATAGELAAELDLSRMPCEIMDDDIQDNAPLTI